MEQQARKRTNVGLIKLLGVDNYNEQSLIITTVGFCHDIFYYKTKIPLEICHLITFFIGTLFKYLDRFGFPMLTKENEKDHKIRVRKETILLDKWTNILTMNSSNLMSQDVEHWKRIKSKHESKIKSIIRNEGIAQPYRYVIWPNLCDSNEKYQIECKRYGNKSMFNDLVSMNENTFWHDAIWNDIEITYTSNIRNTQFSVKKIDLNHGDWKEKYYHIKYKDNESIKREKYATPTQMDLYNILKAFCLFRKDIGYCNGMQLVAAILLMFNTQQQVFWILVGITDNSQKYGMDNLWRYGNPDLPLRLYQLDRFIKKILPKIHKHFIQYQFIYNNNKNNNIFSKCFLSIFLSTNMRFDCLVRIYDLFLNEGIKTIFRMIIGYLKYFESEILKCNDKNEIMEILSYNWSKLNTDQFFKVCFSSKMTHSEIQSFQKDYKKSLQY